MWVNKKPRKEVNSREIYMHCVLDIHASEQIHEHLGMIYLPSECNSQSGANVPPSDE